MGRNRDLEDSPEFLFVSKGEVTVAVMCDIHKGMRGIQRTNSMPRCTTVSTQPPS